MHPANMSPRRKAMADYENSPLTPIKNLICLLRAHQAVSFSDPIFCELRITLIDNDEPEWRSNLLSLH